jgi:excisionase family DNA binding protein
MKKSMITAVTGKSQRPHDAEGLVQDGLMTIREAQAFLRLSRSTLYVLMEQRKLPYVSLGGARRIPKRAVIALAAAGVRGDASALPASREPDGVFPKNGGGR